MKSSIELERRDLLRGGAAFAGLVLAMRLAPPAVAAAAAEPFAPNAWLRIAPDGKVTVSINKAEMGQGVCTSLAMLVAEELDADWAEVGFEFAPVDPAYNHPGMPLQFTGGSTSILGMSQTLREAGASARAMLVAAAAARFGVPATECTTRASQVEHPATSRRASYAELVEDAARLPVPQDVVLKSADQFRLIGKSMKRLDTPAKLAGTATFAIDVARPGKRVALVAHPPVFGGKALRWNEAAAMAIPGVRSVHALKSGVAVVADGFWAAKRGRDALDVQWDLGENAKISTEVLRAEYRELSRKPGMVARKEGSGSAALTQGERTHWADYELPYLAHAPMEPLNCVVELRDGSMEIWAGTQFQTIDHAAAAAAAGLAPEKVKLHTTFLGGGFGRRANPASDYIVEAVEIAKRAGGAIHLVWTREDDMRSGYYRPQWHSRIGAGWDDRGEIQAWSHTIVGQSFIAGTPFEPFIIKNGIDDTSVEGAADLHYAIPNIQVELHTTQVGVPTLWWRSVGHSHTAFVVESFLDELAHATGVPPIELRRKLLARQPRHLGVLETAWGAAARHPLPKGAARGVAVHYSFQSYVAHVVDASIERGKPKVHRVVAAIDCGRVVNPDTVVAQLEGAIGFGLTAALYGEITLEEGRVKQSNFHDYRMLRIHEMPAVEVQIVQSDAPSTGVGEPGVPGIAPALCNALFQVTGKRIRRLPIRAEDLIA